ncbi:prepilin peptidase [Azotobacter chroococcum]
MSSDNLLIVVVLLALLGCAVVVDVCRHRIPNSLVLIGMVLSLLCQFSLTGMNGLISCWLGVLVGFGLFLPFYSLGGMAAGDVKLMAMAGDFLGPWQRFLQ